MNPFLATTRRGMTLIELMVVVAIVGLLAVSVLPTLGTSAEKNRTSGAARAVSDFIAKSHSRAIGGRTWSGFTLIVSASSQARELTTASIPPPYSGDTIGARLAIQSGTSVIRTALPASICPTINLSPITATPAELINAQIVSATTGDLIQFDRTGAFYELTTLTTGSLTFRLRGADADATITSGSAVENASQAMNNTPWPAETPVTHTFEIFRQPVRGGDSFQIPSGRVIDLKWSGYGPSASAYTRLETTADSITVLFDTAGRMRQILRGATREAVTGPVYLLVGRADRAGNAFANLSADDDTVGTNCQYSDSVWVAVDPLTGAVTTATCAPITLATSGTSVDHNNNINVVNSQRWARRLPE